MYRAKNVELLTNKDQVLPRGKEYFEQHLNEGEEREEREEREEIESALKYLKNNKAAGADSLAAELLKNGSSQLVDALEGVIQLAWTSETLPENWTKEVFEQKRQ
jgi:hypothetical protein